MQYFKVDDIVHFLDQTGRKICEKLVELFLLLPRILRFLEELPDIILGGLVQLDQTHGRVHLSQATLVFFWGSPKCFNLCMDFSKNDHYNEKAADQHDNYVDALFHIYRAKLVLSQNQYSIVYTNPILIVLPRRLVV